MLEISCMHCVTYAPQHLLASCVLALDSKVDSLLDCKSRL
jgi:hypothetical protein